MNVAENLSFPSTYVCDTKPGWPERNEPIVQARVSKAHMLSGSCEFLQLRIYPASQPSWFAEIEIIDESRGSAIFSTPDPNCLLVKAGWCGYIVNTLNRRIVELDVEPLRQVVPDPFRQILWCADWDTLTALSGDGLVLWRSDRLVMDDLEILQIGREWVHIRGYLSEPDMRISVPGGLLPG